MFSPSLISMMVHSLGDEPRRYFGLSPTLTSSTDFPATINVALALQKVINDFPSTK